MWKATVWLRGARRRPDSRPAHLGSCLGSFAHHTRLVSSETAQSPSDATEDSAITRSIHSSPMNMSLGEGRTGRATNDGTRGFLRTIRFDQDRPRTATVHYGDQADYKVHLFQRLISPACSIVPLIKLAKVFHPNSRNQASTHPRCSIVQQRRIPIWTVLLRQTAPKLPRRKVAYRRIVV